MVIMDQPILSILLFSAVLALLVFGFGFILSAVTGRHRDAMSILDLVLLIAFFAVVIYVLKLVNVWPSLIVGI